MAPIHFARTRDAMHHALQVVSAWAATHLEADAEHQFANVAWDDTRGAWIGRTAHGLSAGLRAADATWFLSQGDDVLAERGVAGSTLDEALAWLRETATSTGAPDLRLAAPGYELPAHPVLDGAPFAEGDPESLTYLACAFATATAAVTRAVSAEPHASDVRVWPHHFDVASLIVLDGPDADPEHARSVNLGMSPGDASIEGPYLYATPWPPPPTDQLPALGVGRWHTEGWVGAVLDDPSWPGDHATVDAFMRCVAKAKEALG